MPKGALSTFAKIKKYVRRIYEHKSATGAGSSGFDAGDDVSESAERSSYPRPRPWDWITTCRTWSPLRAEKDVWISSHWHSLELRGEGRVYGVKVTMRSLKSILLFKATIYFSNFFIIFGNLVELIHCKKLFCGELCVKLEAKDV